MRPQEFDPLFMLVLASFVGVSLYAAWLWLNLWFTRQVLNRLAVIHADANHHEPGSSGCAGIVFFLLIVGLLLGWLVTAA